MANFLTILRFVLTPIFVVLLFSKGMGWAATAVFAFAALTDTMDGQFARRWGRVTRFGTIADPIADRLLAVTVVVALFIHSQVPPLWAVVTLVGRDLFLVAGFFVLRADRKELAVSTLGKAATATLFGAFILLVASTAEIAIRPWGLALYYIGLALYLAAAAGYVRQVLGARRREASS